MNMMKLVAENRKVGRALVQFAGKLEATPSDKLFQSVEMVDKWLKQAVLLKRLADENAARRRAQLLSGEVDDIEEDKLENQLKNLELQYEKLFPKSQATVFSSEESKEQILGFAKEWDFDWDPLRKQFIQPSNEVRNSLQSLVDSIQTLRDSMRALRNLEFVLESTKELRIWSPVANTPTGGMASKNDIKNAIHACPFRLKTTVIFDNTKVDSKSTNVNTSPADKNSSNSTSRSSQSNVGP
jgi:hypothetical protein